MESWTWGWVRGETGELEVRGQVTFVSQGGTLGPNLWVAALQEGG